MQARVRLPWWAFALLCSGAAGAVAGLTTYAIVKRGGDAAAQGLATFSAAMLTAALARALETAG